MGLTLVDRVNVSRDVKIFFHEMYEGSCELRILLCSRLSDLLEKLLIEKCQLPARRGAI